MNIAISAETTIDLSPELIKKFDFRIVPFSVTLGDRTDFDGNITSKDIFEFYDKTGNLPKTSAVNEFQFDEHFSKLREEFDAVIHFSLSSEMSSAYRNACLAAEKLSNVYVIDSRALSTGIALEAIYARKLVEQGKDPLEIVELVKNRIPFCQSSFVLSNVNFLYKGGRCSTVAYLSVNLLKLRPQIVVKDGSMVAGKKFRGKYSMCINEYVEQTLSQFNNPDLDTVFITYTSADDKDVDAVRKTLQERGFKNIYNTEAGATITSHCGAGTLGILYFNDGEH